jgi:histidinol phosphatase-like enzyme (inositol monophosphatase family)
LTEILEFMRGLARAAAAETLPRFRRRAAVDNKLDAGFDPVTEADREAEKVIRRMLGERFPDDGILGEEFGLSNADSSQRWVIDPIDGTRAFISGLPLWGTLVGLTVDGRAVAGMMSQPFTGELYLADETGAFLDGPGGRRLKTSDVTELSDATLCTTTPALFGGAKRACYDRLEAGMRLARYGTDCYAYAMLASGHVDLVVEPGLQAYDIVALIPLIENAGGVVTTFEGGRPENGGDIIAAANAELHAKARALLIER